MPIFFRKLGKLVKYLVICSKHFHYHRAVSNAGGPSLDRSAATPRSLAKQVPDGKLHPPNTVKPTYPPDFYNNFQLQIVTTYKK